MFRRILCAAMALALFAAVSGRANAEDLQAIDIPAQDLSLAIAELGEETGLRIVIADQLASGKTSVAVTGSMTATEALRRLLAGTALSPQPIGEDGFIVTSSDTVGGTSQDTVEELFLADEIVVRGELIERSLQDSQTSAVVVSGEELNQRGETDLTQTLRRVPGVSEGNDLVLRGVNSDGGLGSAATSSTISITADGIRLSDYRNTDRTQISTWDVEQVEVLRGPQSTQSGRNALVGAIIVESVDPQYSPEYKFRVGPTEVERNSGEGTGYQAAFVLNTPIVDDRIAVRLSADKQEAIDGSRDFQTIRGKLRLDPIENLSLGVAFSHVNGASDIGDEGSARSEFRSPSLTLDYDINDALTFSSRSQYTEAVTGFETAVPILSSTALRDRQYETIEQELQLAYETETIRAIGGFFYTNLSEESLLEVVAPTARSTLVEDIETKNFAVYGELEYDLSDHWTLIAGARYDVEKVINTSTASIFLPNGFTLASQEGTFDNTYSAFLPKVGAVYNFNDDVSLGATYQRGYRAGGVGVGVNATSLQATTFEFDPEFTDTFELAFRSRSSDGNRILNANLFYTKWSDQQVLDLDAFGNGIISNAADSRLWGAEVEFNQFVTDAFEVFASAAYVNTRYNDFVVGGVQQAGNEFLVAPELTATFGANYTFSNGFSIGGDANYTSSTFSDSANTAAFENDDFWLVNLNANYSFENGAELTAYVRNLFDKEYTTQISATGPEFNRVGEPREFGLLLTMTF